MINHNSRTIKNISIWYMNDIDEKLVVSDFTYYTETKYKENCSNLTTVQKGSIGMVCTRVGTLV